MSEEEATSGGEQRRSGNGSPPTVLMVAYQRMDPDLKKLLQKVGAGMIAFGIAMPMVGELFIPLSWVYWLFAAGVVMLGACFMYLPIGIWFGNFLGGLAVKVIPALRGKLAPDRRGDAAEKGD